MFKTKSFSIVFSVAILFLLGSYANAEPITQEIAQQAAEAFLLNEQAMPPNVASKKSGEFIIRDLAAGLTIGEILPINSNKGTPLAYIQELEPYGFIITSADDNIRPVLGYSFAGSFDYDRTKSNPLLDLIEADVQARLESAYDENMTMGMGSLTEWGPWLQTTWHQGTHWNDKCPYRDPQSQGDRRVVGCVATALAQIVNYWEYPKSISFSESESFRLSGDPASFADATEYGFPTVTQINDALQNILYNGDSEEEAYLCFGLGVKLNMNYKVSQSGANTYLARSVLKNELDYGSVSAQTDRSGVWSQNSSDIIKDLMNGWPVQIAIHKADKRGGHSIVVDGYRDDGFFHLNYGWGSDSPDAINSAWYNIPSNMPDYDIVHTVVYGIAKYLGWNQIGADQRNSYRAIYPAPIYQPERKWCVSIPSGLPISYSFSHLVVGTGGRIYASLKPSTMGDEYHPYIAIYDKFGSLENLIEITASNVEIPYLCQNSLGEVFFSSGTGGPGSTDSKVYRLNPETDEITLIFTHNSPDAGMFDGPFKVDPDGYLYFVISPRFADNYAKFYCLDRTGATAWTPYSFPSSAQFFTSQPAIDEDNNRIYLNYFNKTEAFKGESHLIAFNRSNGVVIFDEVLPNIPTHYSSSMAGPPSIGEDGTVYVGAYSKLYAYSESGTKLWEKSFSAYSHSRTPAIGPDGTLYVNYGKDVRALDPADGVEKWHMSFSLGDNDYMGEVYAAANGMVIFSYVLNEQDRMGGVKDNGETYGSGWDMVGGGGTLAFGSGRTILSISTGQENSICSWTDKGDSGDPDGKGMDYTDNDPPHSPSTPSPTDGLTDHSYTSIQLSWNCSDPNFGQESNLRYDIFVCAFTEGEEAAFVPVASHIDQKSCTLSNLLENTQYLWTVVATDGQAISEGPIWSFVTATGPHAVEDEKGVTILPESFELDQNYPNPFNPNTEIKFALPRRSDVSIAIYNILGRKIKTLVNENLSAGYKSITWDGTNNQGHSVSTGIYFYRIQAGEFVDTKKMLLLK